MVNVTAATSFFGTRQEGMWLAGDTKRVSARRAEELIQEGLAIESSDQSEPDEPATEEQQDELPPTTLDSLKEKKEKRSTKEDKSDRKTKDE